jgi:MerR family regulatory protein
LTISRLARLAGVNLETIRYYERRGFCPRLREPRQNIEFSHAMQRVGYGLSDKPLILIWR